MAPRDPRGTLRQRAPLGSCRRLEGASWTVRAVLRGSIQPAQGVAAVEPVNCVRPNLDEWMGKRMSNSTVCSHVAVLLIHRR